MTDAVVVGAGPAGLSAALELLARGMSVVVVDDQRAPGGRIFAGIEGRAIHSAEDRAGADLVARFRASGGTYLAGAEAWQIEAGPRVFLSFDGRARSIAPRFVVLATGAQERPMPFPGWQLPGVVTVGAAQILLKTALRIPDRPVWIAGSGPLLLLYAHQLREAGGSVAGILDTAPRGRLPSALLHAPGALAGGWRDILRGLGWMFDTRGLDIVRGVDAIEADGAGRLETVRYTTRGGRTGEIPTDLLLVHDGVIPAVHNTMAAGIPHRWNRAQSCFEPIVDVDGATPLAGLYVVGDAAGVRGAGAAALMGRLAGISICRAAGAMSKEQARRASRPLKRRLAATDRFRKFVDALYPPTALAIPDATMVCRCEEVTAADIRQCLAIREHLGPDGIKAETRAGMGPCQGRQCGSTLTRLVREVHGTPSDHIDFLRIRPPLKPLTLSELAALDTTDD